TGGNRVAVKVTGDKIQSYIQGPDDPTAKEKKPLKVPFRIDFNGADDGCILRVGRETITLKINEFSDWIRLTFKTKLGLSIKGICRFCLRQIYPHFELYVSPINIDPEYPVLPISRPSLYSKYLSKLNGLFGTLGLMEDTWALNEGALDDEAFLKQVYLTHAEREKMLFDALEKTRGGLCMCVFDATDRVQHTFWRYLEQGHPSETNGDGRFKEAIPAIYEKMDTLVGRIMDALGDRDVLLVLSDHGFNSFRRCVNLNTWLVKNGYMALKDPIEGKDYFGDVDWSATRAFSLGMAGVFLNIRGRESKGIVDPRESERLKFEIAEKLRRLCDPLDGKRAIRRVYDSQKIYKGPYKEEAPDLIIGWEEGFRASWECVTGKLKLDVFENNKKAWSGDHCVDPGIVPGVLFCNRRLAHDTPRMIDIAPTVLRLFDIKIPRYMEGKASDIIW
ncbi:MAG: alkaline phosphatase family protein, partial [Candidatus Hodarchaeota archaeon]